MATSFELALSTVFVKIWSIPYWSKQDSVTLPMVSLLWSGTRQKFKIILW